MPHDGGPRRFPGCEFCWLTCCRLAAEQQLEHFKTLDEDEDGEISLEEFEAWWNAMEAENLLAG